MFNEKLLISLSNVGVLTFLKSLNGMSPVFSHRMIFTEFEMIFGEQNSPKSLQVS